MGVFSPGGSLPLTGPVSTTGSKATRHVMNVTLGLAGVESTITVPVTAVSFYLVERTRTARLRIADTSGASNTTYETLPQGCSLSEEGLDGTSVVMYVNSNKDGSIVELVWWS